MNANSQNIGNFCPSPCVFVTTSPQNDRRTLPEKIQLHGTTRGLFATAELLTSTRKTFRYCVSGPLATGRQASKQWMVWKTTGSQCRWRSDQRTTRLAIRLLSLHVGFEPASEAGRPVWRTRSTPQIRSLSRLVGRRLRGGKVAVVVHELWKPAFRLRRVSTRLSQKDKEASQEQGARTQSWRTCGRCCWTFGLLSRSSYHRLILPSRDQVGLQLDRYRLYSASLYRSVLYFFLSRNGCLYTSVDENTSAQHSPEHSWI